MEENFQVSLPGEIMFIWPAISLVNWILHKLWKCREKVSCSETRKPLTFWPMNSPPAPSVVRRTCSQQPRIIISREITPLIHRRNLIELEQSCLIHHDSWFMIHGLMDSNSNSHSHFNQSELNLERNQALPARAPGWEAKVILLEVLRMS